MGRGTQSVPWGRTGLPRISWILFFTDVRGTNSGRRNFLLETPERKPYAVFLRRSVTSLTFGGSRTSDKHKAPL